VFENTYRIRIFIVFVSYHIRIRFLAFGAVSVFFAFFRFFRVNCSIYRV
jgi:hypothetical protein